MKRFSIISTILVIFSLYSFAQKDVIISGGNAVSATVCSNGYVYVWGFNRTSSSYGILGTGSSSDYVSTPQRVQGFSSVKQVNAGGGSFAAVDCEGKVYCWGDNIYGQCGQGVTGGVATQPYLVKAGVLTGTEYDDGNGYLCNVSTVCVGNGNVFAILGGTQYQGYVVAWGGNGESYVSCLGDGTTDDQSEPVWCIDLSGNKVKHISQISVSHNVTMLLDEDGHVWTAGGMNSYQTTLGRLAEGGYAATASSTGSTKFGMVYVAENEPLSDIVQIATGAVNSHALDKDGYVWGWGDSWNSACGIGANVSSSFPMKVVAGLLGEEDTQGGYLQAKSISAGQSCGFAVSKTGKPVIWGGLTVLNSSSYDPRYIEYSGSFVHDDVLWISGGNDCAFYGRSDGFAYAWGGNTSGQLGIGSTTNQTKAVRMNPPTGCSFRDPVPLASISSSDITTCAASAFEGVTLDCGFYVDATLADNYQITWYKDGVQVQTGNLASYYTYTTPTGEQGIGT